MFFIVNNCSAYIDIINLNKINLNSKYSLNNVILNDEIVSTAVEMAWRSITLFHFPFLYGKHQLLSLLADKAENCLPRAPEKCLPGALFGPYKNCFIIVIVAQ